MKIKISRKDTFLLLGNIGVTDVKFETINSQNWIPLGFKARVIFFWFVNEQRKVMGLKQCHQQHLHKTSLDL